jgi:hypothetical protein
VEIVRYAGVNANKRGEKPETFNFLGFTHEDTLSAIEGGRPPLIDGIDGRRAIEFIMGAY